MTTSSVKQLRERLRSRDLDKRRDAISQLKRIADSDAVALLVEALTSDDASIRQEAASAIVEREDAGAIPYLARLLQVDANHSQFTDIGSCLLELAAICGLSLSEQLPLPQLHLCVRAALHSDKRRVRMQALEELQSDDSPCALELLLELIADHDHMVALRAQEMIVAAATSTVTIISQALRSAAPEAAARLLDAIAATSNSRFVSDVIPFVEHENDQLREKAAMALGKIGDRHAAGSLVKLAEDSADRVRAAACNALGWIGSDAVLDILFAGLDDKSAAVQQAALGALVLIGSPAVVARLNADLSHLNPQRQKMAVKALGWIGEKEVIEPLLAVLNNRDWQLRKSALDALGRIEDERAVSAAEAALADEEPRVRQAAIDALVSLGGSKAAPLIATLLHDEDLWVKYQAISAIGQLQATDLADDIIPFLSEINDVLRGAAAKALARINDQRALPLLKNLPADHNAEVAGAVSDAISTLEAST